MVSTPAIAMAEKRMICAASTSGETQAAAAPSSAALASRSAVNRDALAPRLGAAAGDQDRGDDQQRAERAEPDRHIRRQRLEIGDDEGDHDQGADREAADAAVLGRQQRGCGRASPAARRKSAKPASWNSDSSDRVRRGEASSPKRAAKAEQDGAGTAAILAGARRMAPQNAFGDDEGAERHQCRRNQRQPVEPALSVHHATPRVKNSDGDHAEQEQQTPGQRAAGIAPMQRDHGDAEADRAAEIDDGIGDHAWCHRPLPAARPQGAEGARIVHPVKDRQHQPLQRQHGGGRQQRRQRAGRHLALQIAPRAGEIDAAELQHIVAPRIIELAGAERVVLLVAMFWRDIE